jgi:pimeloyl-ACP methyl ester carboxylesterase
VRRSHPLVFGAVGDPAGDPVVALDGIGIRWLRKFGPPSATQTGTRLITIDRRGRASVPGTTGGFTNLVDGIRALLHHLSLPRIFLVAAFSGCRDALEVAAELGHSVLGVSLINPDLPWAATSGWWVAPFDSGRPGGLGREMDAFRREPEPTLQRLERWAASEDLPVLRSRRVRTYMIEELLSAFSIPGLVEAEVARQVSPLSVDLGDITARVTVWHGARDPVHPIDASRELVGALPRGQLVTIPTGGALWFVDLERTSGSVE